MSREPGGALPPGSVIGIVGGGQLGRMLGMAAAQLGYRCHIYAPDEAPCAAQVAERHVRGAYDDKGRLAAFASDIDVATYEFENIPAGPLEAIAGRVAIHPPVAALELAQDRLFEKRFVLDRGGRPADFRAVASRDELGEALAAIGTPAILKTRRFGYDGKGQVRIGAPDQAEAAWVDIAGRPAVLEALVPFEREFSILLVRGADGEMRLWEAPDNRHEDGILAESIAPGAGIVAEQAEEAAELARSVAEALGYVGVLAMEFFASAGGPVFNEIAPRVHNSGHWTIEGAVTSQFENHVRAICGLPLGDTSMAAGRAEMHNLIGAAVEGWSEILNDDRAHLHLYDKGEARPGRKMGHVTRLF